MEVLKNGGPKPMLQLAVPRDASDYVLLHLFLKDD